jgi:hypothetical protein
MGLRRQLPSRTSRSAAAGSWLALLAATTLGDAADTLRAEVRADGLSDGRRYRLVIQSYDKSDGAVPGADSRPVGSTQRAVTADELREGVQVDLLELRHAASAGDGRPLVVAWIEAANQPQPSRVATLRGFLAASESRLAEARAGRRETRGCLVHDARNRVLKRRSTPRRRTAPLGKPS